MRDEALGLDPEEQAVETVKLGADAEAFLRTRLGKYMMERAELDIAQGMTKLYQAPAYDHDLNESLRNQIALGYMFKDWIAEVISAGALAERQLIENEATD